MNRDTFAMLLYVGVVVALTAIFFVGLQHDETVKKKQAACKTLMHEVEVLSEPARFAVLELCQ